MTSGKSRSKWSLGSLFGLNGPVRRQEYVWVGLVAMPLKYFVEAVVIFRFTGHSYSPLDFINPLLSSREQLVAWVENVTQQNPTYEVVSSIKIHAPIETVWENVIHFSDISAEPSWYFRMGIAYPTRAHIVGTGVGAQRFCEFSTGTFVEPITAWQRPTQLSFNVSQQPDPMFELTPYRHIHPPHLNGAFRSVRGEFRLARRHRDTFRLVAATQSADRARTSKQITLLAFR
ncbi:MAG: hypothetical protein IT422_15610 [Pirellulaceae bacterium]|nr:hypothetical protein [Pirellulaceae bacterium]